MESNLVGIAIFPIKESSRVGIAMSMQNDDSTITALGEEK
jgi:hypothetical protein